MGFDKVVFKAIDWIYNPLQNRHYMLRKQKKDVTVTKDIPFGNEKICKLNTYVVKKESGKYPVVFVIHGGGFVAGDKKYRRCISGWLAEETGAFVVNVNYGLGPKYHFEQSIAHLAAAVDWVYDNQEKYNLDLSRFLATGDSSGGYYVAELAAIQNSEVMQKRLNVKMKAKFTAIALNCGLYDIDIALSQKTLFNISGSVCKSFVGIDIKNIKDYEYLDVVSPIKFVNENFPKSFVIYAKQDFFCGGQGEMLVEKLNENNVYNKVYFSEEFKYNHTFPSVWKGKPAVEANNLMLEFIKEQFKND